MDDMTGISRRGFIAAVATCAGCPLAAGVLAAAEAGSVDLGPVADFAKDGIVDRWGATQGFFLVRRGRRLFPPSAICTHRKVTLASVDGQLKCPKHGSVFTADGSVRKGPARRGLPRFGISTDAN